MRNWKVALILVLTVLLVVTILQNTAAVETKFLFMTVTMPRAMLLGITLLVGFALGLIAAQRWKRKT